MTFEEIKNEQAKVDAMDCKEYAVDLCITEKNFKDNLKLFIGSMNMSLDEIMSHGKDWHLWF